MKKLLILCSCIMAAVSITASACTGISLKTKDNNNIQARTIEFGEYNLNSRVIISPEIEILHLLLPRGNRTDTNGKLNMDL